MDEPRLKSSHNSDISPQRSVETSRIDRRSSGEKHPPGGGRGCSVEGKLTVAGRLLLYLIQIYQALFSPWFGHNCRYQPTCSNYMMEAVIEWGAVRGGWMGLKRIGRCHPWGRSGYDPVPGKDEGNRK